MTKCTQNPIDAGRLHRQDCNEPGRQPTYEGLEVQGSWEKIPNDCASWALRSSDRSVTSSSLVFDKCYYNSTLAILRRRGGKMSSMVHHLD